MPVLEWEYHVATFFSAGVAVGTIWFHCWGSYSVFHLCSPCNLHWLHNRYDLITAGIQSILTPLILLSHDPKGIGSDTLLLLTVEARVPQECSLTLWWYLQQGWCPRSLRGLCWHNTIKIIRESTYSSVSRYRHLWSPFNLSWPWRGVG